MKIAQQPLDLIRAHCVAPRSPGLAALCEAARARHGGAVRAVLFYGSCLRSGDVGDGLADLYLLVDSYAAAFDSRPLAVLNRLLPPNVFYLEVPHQGKTLRAKYAVLTLDDFQRGNQSWFHSYLWGRFAQRCGLIYAADAAVAERVYGALASAVMTFVRRTLPQMTSPFTARELWSRGLSLSYRSELRTEQPEGSVRLFDADPDYYSSLTAALLARDPFDREITAETDGYRLHAEYLARRRRLNSLAWRVRAAQGKLLSALRLLKALATFKGGVDYILWKIERHSGERVDVSPALRRFTPLAVLVIFWRLYRRNAFR